MWVIYGGGFYEVVKYVYGLEKMLEIFYWFKWEVYIIWLLGFVFLVLVYYFGVFVYLIDFSVNNFSFIEVISLGLGLIFGGLFVYEMVCRSLLVKYLLLFGLCLVVLICVVMFLLI